jgi:hypothetical protein
LNPPKALSVLVVLAVVSALAGCPTGRIVEPEAAWVSPQAHADYELFALRCSKCHSLARPLNSGIDEDEYWRMYVDKMRRQPGSGISEDDAFIILRFLHVYSIEERRKKGKTVDVPEASVIEQPDAASPPGAP